MSQTKIITKRIPILDEVRGFTVLIMIIYHAAYSWAYIFDLHFGYSIVSFLFPIHYVIPFPFIFISGICTKLSRSNLRRGLLLLIPALLINIVTIILERYIRGVAIYFGVINMLSVVMIFYGLFCKYFEKIPSRMSFIVCLIFFTLTWGIRLEYVGIFGIKLVTIPDTLYETNFMFPIGFPNRGFESSDYFPIIPWIFLFLAGAYFADIMKNTSVVNYEKLYKTHSRALSFVGKHSLYIYMAHQPVICAITYAILYLLKH